MRVRRKRREGGRDVRGGWEAETETREVKGREAETER